MDRKNFDTNMNLNLIRQEAIKQLIDTDFEKSLDYDMGLSELYGEFDEYTAEKFIKLYEEQLGKAVNNLHDLRVNKLLQLMSESPDFKPEKLNQVSCIQYILNATNSIVVDEKHILSDEDRGLVSDLIKPINSETLKAWLTGKREPDRISIFKISFALNLPLDQSKVYSHQTLFNKVFGQRYCTRNPEEMCFMYAKKNNKTYIEALKLYAEYLKNHNTAQNEESIGTKSSKSTIAIFQDERISGSDDKSFINALLSMEHDLNDKSTSLLQEIQNVIDMFSDSKIMKSFNNDYESIKVELTENYGTNKSSDVRVGDTTEKDARGTEEKNNFAYSVLISQWISKNMQNLIEANASLKKLSDDKIQELEKIIVNSVYVEPEEQSSKDTDKMRSEAEADIHELILSLLDDESESSISHIKPIEKAIISTVGLSKNDIYPNEIQKLKDRKNYYNALRCSLILTHFFDYWKDISSNNKEQQEDYLDAINEKLSQNYFNRLYPFVPFDLYFLLCAHTKYPIRTYYAVLEHIVLKYQIDRIDNSEVKTVIQGLKILSQNTSQK